MKPVTVREPRGPMPARPSNAKTVLRGLVVIAVFALLGPVIGGVITIAGFIAFGFNLVSFSDAGLSMLALTAYGIWLAYPIGILPAAVVGLIVAVRDNFASGTRFYEAALIGLIVGAAFGFFIGRNPSGNQLFAWLVVAGSVVASVVCWWLTRRWKRFAGPSPMVARA